jgi:hypothetical protein
MGSSFAEGKLGLAYISPLLLVGIRFTLAGLLMAQASPWSLQVRHQPCVDRDCSLPRYFGVDCAVFACKN